MSPLKKNIIANYLGKIWTSLMSIIFLPFYIKFMGIEAYGLVGIYLFFLAIFSVLEVSIGGTLNRELAISSTRDDPEHESRHMLRTLEVVYWSLAVILGLVIVALSPWVATYWLDNRTLSLATVQEALVIMGIAIAFQLPFSLYSGGLMGLQQQVKLNIITTAAITLRSLGALFILWKISPTIQAFFILQILINLLQTLVTASVLWKYMPASSDKPFFRTEIITRLSPYTFGLVGTSFLALIVSQIDKITLSKILSLEAFGYYTFAWVIASGLYYIIAPIYQAFFPRLSQLVEIDNKEELVRLYHHGCQLMSVCVLPLAIVIIFFSKDLLLIWTQNPELTQNAHLILSLLLIVVAITGLNHIPYAMQLAHGWTRIGLVSNLVTLVFLTSIIVVLTLEYGAIGACISLIMVHALRVPVTLYFMHRKILKNELKRWYLDDVASPLIAAFFVVATGYYVFDILHPKNMSAIYQLSYIAVIFIVAFIIAMLSAPLIRSRLLRSEYLFAHKS